MPPRGLTPTLPRLPPILHGPRPRPAASWSKAARGLFVLPRVAGIFTGPAVSPGPPLRQRPGRSTFRAGRNLPDKEFRYLRTVIVTAAVYRGFSSKLAPLPLTFRHWAGLSPYVSALGAFAGTGVFGKQSPGPARCGPLGLRPRRPSPYTRRPFSRSYGANLPSSLAGVLPSTWVCSTSPPVSVCGTGADVLARGFSRRVASIRSAGCPASPSSLGVETAQGDFPPRTTCALGRPSLAPGPSPPRPPIAHHGHRRHGNLNPLSIAYASRPRLRPGSPAADQPGRGTLGHSVGGVRAPLALLVPTFALPPAPPRLPPRLLGWTGRSPTTSGPHVRSSAASVPGLSPGGLSAPRHDRPVSCYALFQGWLLLSQPPGCRRAATALPTEPGLGDLSRRSGLFPSRRRNLAPAVSRPRASPRHSAFGSGR